MSVSSKRVTVGGLTDLSYKRVLQSGVFWTKEEMNCTDGYLEVQGEKIKAGTVISGMRMNLMIFGSTRQEDRQRTIQTSNSG